MVVIFPYRKYLGSTETLEFKYTIVHKWVKPSDTTIDGIFTK